MVEKAPYAPRPEDGEGNETKESLFLYCGTYGPEYPPGHRPGGVWFFARWRKFLWHVLLETVGRHAVQAKHDEHPLCGAGSVMVLRDDPYITLFRSIIDFREKGDSAREKELIPFVVFPIEERKCGTLNVIVNGCEILWRDIERVALNLVRWNGGNPSRVRCIWKDRDDARGRRYWEYIHREHIKKLRCEPPRIIEGVLPENIARIAHARGVTSDEVRKSLIDDGFTEDEKGSFLRKKPALDEGDGETFALILLGYAKRMKYDGPLYLSAHSWEELLVVAEGQRFIAKFNGKRAWYGYLQGIKRLICIPVHNRFDATAYATHDLPGDPDFLEAMDDVRLGSSDVVDGGTGDTKKA